MADPLVTDGHSVRLWPKASTNYEVAWLGVVTSKIRYVAVK